MNRFGFCLNFAFKFNLRRYTAGLPDEVFERFAILEERLRISETSVGRCRLTL
jgi:hypothetical protein